MGILLKFQCPQFWKTFFSNTQDAEIKLECDSRTAKTLAWVTTASVKLCFPLAVPIVGRVLSYVDFQELGYEQLHCDERRGKTFQTFFNLTLAVTVLP